MLRFSEFTFKQKRLIKKVYKETLKVLNLNDDFEIEFNCVTVKQIRDLNYKKRDIDRETDVLSFPYILVKFPFDKMMYRMDVNPQTGKILLGEIDICLEVAINQAKEYGHKIEREIAFLSLHGMLHLFGFDHILKEDEIKMFSLQDEIFNNLSRRNKKLKRD